MREEGCAHVPRDSSFGWRELGVRTSTVMVMTITEIRTKDSSLGLVNVDAGFSLLVSGAARRWVPADVGDGSPLCPCQCRHFLVRA